MLPKKKKKGKWGINISKKKASIFFWALVCVWFAGFLLYSNIKIFGKRAELGKEMSKIDNSVESLTKERESLNFSLGETYSEGYIEKVAREDLGMQKPGESVVVIKKEAENEKSQSGNFDFLQKLSGWFNSIKDRFISPE